MAKKLIEESTLSAIGNSIRAKTGRTYKIPPLDMPAEITSIQTGGSSTVTTDNVNFYDYNGMIVASYSLEEIQDITSLPDAPTHEGLTFQGWNYTLEKVKAFTHSMNVGAIYTTNDGKTRIYITLGEGRTSPLLGCCPNGTVIVDWGDGTAPDTLTGTSTSTIKYTPTHNYASPGNYVISLAVNGTCGFLGSTTSDDECHLLKYSTTVDILNRYYRNAITKIEFGDSVISIGNNAFSNCYSLTSLTIPDSVTSIGDYSFLSCYSLTSLIIPNSVISIGDYSFQSCYSLTNLIIPDSVTSIGNSVFDNCYSLTIFTIPDGVTSIGSGAFNSCYSLTSLTIPNSVTIIENYLFNSCYSLTSLTIPDSVTSIGDNAFSNCYSLTSLTIPDSVTSIGSSAFQKCYSLTNLIIPDSVTSIGNSVFDNCYSLTSLIIPNSVTIIENYLFTSCYSLTSLTIPSNVTNIKDGAFQSCYSLTNLTIPDGVTSIGNSAFNSCYSLTSLIIPDSVTSIGNRAFSNCCGMAEYHLKSTTPPTLSNTTAFSGIPSDCIIYVPKGCLEAYQTATNWATYASHMQEETT